MATKEHGGSSCEQTGVHRPWTDEKRLKKSEESLNKKLDNGKQLFTCAINSESKRAFSGRNIVRPSADLTAASCARQTRQKCIKNNNKHHRDYSV